MGSCGWRAVEVCAGCSWLWPCVVFSLHSQGAGCRWDESSQPGCRRALLAVGACLCGFCSLRRLGAGMSGVACVTTNSLPGGRLTDRPFVSQNRPRTSSSSSCHHVTLRQPRHCAEATNVPWCQKNTTRQIWESFTASQSLCRMWLLHNMYRTWGNSSKRLLKDRPTQADPQIPNQTTAVGHAFFKCGSTNWQRRSWPAST